MALELLKKEEMCCYQKKLFRVFGIAACALFVFVGGVQCREMYQRTQKQAEKQKTWDALVDYCGQNPDNLYLLDVRSMVSYTGKVGEHRSGQENYLLAGGWMSDTPLLNMRLQGALDGTMLLSELSEKCYYVISVDREVSWLQEYLDSRYEEFVLKKTDIVCADGTEVFYVYSRSKE